MDASYSFEVSFNYNGAEQHLCEYCPYMAVCQKALIRHRQLHRPRASALYKCKYCAFWVTEQYHLTSHLRVHTAEYLQKRMKCSQLPETSGSYNCDVEMIPSLVSSSDNSNELDRLPARNVFTTEGHKLDKTTHNSLAVNGGHSTNMANVDGVAAIAEDDADVLAHPRSAFVSLDDVNFQCNNCPFGTTQRSEFFAHMLCHCVRTGAYICPYCTFCTALSDRLSAHIFLHFNLPGCQPSSLSPNVCQSEDWKQLDAAIEAIVQRHSYSAGSHCVLYDNHNNWSDDQVESESLLEADAVMFENPATRLPDSEDDPSVTNSVSTLRVNCNAVDSMDTLSTVPQSVLTDKQHVSVTHFSKAAADSSSVDILPSADSVTSVLVNKTKFCRYCDKVIRDSGALVKHEAGHLTGCKQPVP